MDTGSTLQFLELDLWVYAALMAAIAQTLRSATQKKMKPVLGDMGAAYIRFSYALPFAWAGVLIYSHSAEAALPQMTATFWLWVVLASVMQVLFTIFLIKMFSHRSFAAGTAFSKTEVLQAAIFEALLLGVVVTALTGSAIVIGAVAVVMLSLAQAKLTRGDVMARLFSGETLLGLLSGATLGLSTVFFKAAVLGLNSEDWLIAALFTGAMAVTIQTLGMGGWMVLSSARGEFALSLKHWRGSMGAGFWGAVATACWFTGFTLYAVAPVRAVGQVELLITLFISIFYFKEKTNKTEAVAIILLVLSIVMILMDR